MATMTEIRWHGRGGQGAKTAATLVGEIAIEEGKYGQGFPEYGPERMGAPIRGFTRISDAPINQHCAIAHPDIVVILDPTLLEPVDVCENLKDNGIVIVNTHLDAAAIRPKLSKKNIRLFLVNATQIAMDTIGRPIPNTPMMGALIKAAGILKLETVEKDMIKKFSKKFSQKIVDANVTAVRRAFEEVKQYAN
ncbi:MAG: 2-oxoacid:acceptor oxidoreductase family protein [Planctomycetota bacterium]